MSKSLIKQLCTVGTFVVCAFSLVACQKSQQPNGRKKRGTANRSLAQVEMVQAPEAKQAE